MKRLAGSDSAWNLGVLVLLIVIWALVLTGLSDEMAQVAITSLISLVVVVGTYIFVGNSGVISFGHAGFMALGAYVSAILSLPAATKSLLLPELPGVLANAELGGPLALAVAILAVALFALLAGLSLVRLSGVAASIATFALLVIVYQVLTNYKAITGTGGTLTGIPTTTTLGAVLATALASVLVAYLFGKTTTGFRLRASREDELAARSVGVGVARERLAAFVLSAAVVAAGGSLFGHYLGTVSPLSFWLPLTFLTLAMLVVGGLRTLSGAVLGTFVVTALVELLSKFEEGFTIAGLAISGRPGVRDVVLSLLMIAILILRPKGLMGGRELGEVLRGALVGLGGRLGGPGDRLDSLATEQGRRDADG